MPQVKRYLSASILSLIDQFGQAIGVLVSGILLVRFIGTDGFGLVTLATVATSIAIIINAAVILDPAAQIAQTYSGQASEYARAVFGLSSLLALPLALVSSLIFAVIASDDFGQSVATQALVAFLAVAQTLYFTIRRLSLATHRGIVAACLSATGAVSFVVGVLLLHLWGALSVGSWIAVQSLLYASLSVVGALVICRGGGGAPVSMRSVVRAHGVQARPLLVLNGANFIAVQSPVILLDHFAGAAAVGVFRSLLNLVQPFTLLMLAMVNAFVPIVARAERPGIAPDIAGGVCVLAVCSAGIVGYSWEDWLIPLLFGPSFHPPAYSLAVLLCGVLFQAVQSGSVIRFRATGHLRPLAFSQILAAVVAPAATALLAPRFGIMGAVVASSAALATSCIYILSARVAVSRKPSGPAV